MQTPIPSAPQKADLTELYAWAQALVAVLARPAPLEMPAWVSVKKTVDEVRSATTTLTNDAALAFPLLANKSYILRGKLFFDTSALGDFKWRHTGPASPLLVRIKRGSLAPGDTAFTTLAVDTSFSSGDIVITSAAANGGFVDFEGLIQNGANAGAFAIQWAQNTSDAGATTVRAGSYLEWLNL